MQRGLQGESRAGPSSCFAPTRRHRSDALTCGRGDAQRVQCVFTAREPSTQFSQPSKRQRIVVLGGGLGGLYAAIRLDMLVWQGEKPEVRGGHVESRARVRFPPHGV